MRKLLLMGLSLLLVALPAVSQGKHHDRLRKSGEVLREILNMPDSIPQGLLDKAECIIIMPSVKKAALGIGGSYGRGAMVCRTGARFTGPWGAPAMYRLEGASIGFQIGGSATDYLLLVMNPKGAKSIMKSKVKLGADATAAAGPKGRSAEASTDAFMRAEILTYSRSRGAFAGVSLKGSTLRQDKKANEEVYGRKIEAKSILLGGQTRVPQAGGRLVSLLQKASSSNKSKKDKISP
jgi:lipid-binding SYLF domain-containing protein